MLPLNNMLQQASQVIKRNNVIMFTRHRPNLESCENSLTGSLCLHIEMRAVSCVPNSETKILQISVNLSSEITFRVNEA